MFEFNYLFLVFLLLEAGSLVPKIHLQLEKKRLREVRGMVGHSAN